MKKEIRGYRGRLAEIRARQGEFLLACEEILSIEAEHFEAPLRFATSPGTFVAEGWVPTGRVAAVKDALVRASEGKVYVAEIEADHDDREVPVESENPPFVRPTELITDLYSRPRYLGLDPTLIIALIFPIFFGLILGDVGYGALILAVSIILSRLFTSGDAAKLFTVLRNCSISSIIFGFLFSEFFGFEFPWHPILFSRHLVIGEARGGAEHRRAHRSLGLDRGRPAHPREGALRHQQVAGAPWHQGGTGAGGVDRHHVGYPRPHLVHLPHPVHAEPDRLPCPRHGVLHHGNCRDGTPAHRDRFHRHGVAPGA